MIVPGLQELLRDIKLLENYARACQLGEEMRIVPLTREEVDVIASFRRFMDEESDPTLA